MMKKNVISTLLALGLAVSMVAGCGQSSSSESSAVASTTEQAADTSATAASTDSASSEDGAAAASTADASDTADVSDTAAVSSTADAAADAAAEEAVDLSQDRAGNAITVPEDVERIVSMAPSTTRLLIDLGVADKIVGIDTNSASYASDLPADLPQFDMMTPDNEAIVALKPDIVFTSGMSSSGGTDVFQGVRDAGICVADIPSSTSFAGIEDDIRFIGACIQEADSADAIAAQMAEDITKLKEAGSSVPADEAKTVLWEISIPTADYPTIYSAGSGTYLDEMITTVGAENVCGDQESWVSLSEEDAIALNPDVIITNVNYVDDPVGTILAEPGWENVTAIKNKAVYYVDADTSNQPNQHVVDAAISIGKDIYPDVFADWEDPIADKNAAYNKTADSSSDKASEADSAA